MHSHETESPSDSRDETTVIFRVLGTKINLCFHLFVR